MDVEAVADQLHAGIGVQGSGDDAGLAVVQTVHAVVEVGGVAGAAGIGVHGLLVPGELFKATHGIVETEIYNHEIGFVAEDVAVEAVQGVWSVVAAHAGIEHGGVGVGPVFVETVNEAGGVAHGGDADGIHAGIVVYAGIEAGVGDAVAEKGDEDGGSAKGILLTGGQLFYDLHTERTFLVWN